VIHRKYDKSMSTRIYVEFLNLDELNSILEMKEHFSKDGIPDSILIFSIKPNQNWNDLLKEIREVFPKHEIQKIDDFMKESKLTISSFKHAYFIFNSDSGDGENEEHRLRIREHILDASREKVLKQASSAWTVLGDEMGTPGGNMHGRFLYSWVVIPPKTELAPLPIGFHCAGNPQMTELAIKELVKHPEIEIFCFEEHGDSKRQKKSQLRGMPHLDYWEYTSPLVIERICKKSKDEQKVKIFVEEAGNLKPNGIRFRHVVDRLRTQLEPSRPEWERLEIEEMLCLKKDEHPWHGYPDAIGAFLRDRLGFGFHQKYPGFKKRIKVIPYRRKPLHEGVHRLHQSSGEPLKFLKELLDLRVEDSRDYVDQFFGELIDQHTANLTPQEWRKFGKSIRDKNNERCHEAVRIIFENSKPEVIYEHLILLENLNAKFELCMTALGRANHDGDHNSANNFIKAIEELVLENGISPERKKDFILLKNGMSANIFDFKSALEYYTQNPPQDIREHQFDSNNMKYWSDNMQHLAFNGEAAKALEISTEIRTCYRGEVDEGHEIRHTIYSAELLVELKLFEEAKQLLLQISDEGKQGNYFMAIWAKILALNEVNSEEYNIWKENIERLYQYNWNKNHPSQRILYWTARVAKENGDDDFAKHCGSLLRELTDSHSNLKDAFGVILSCQMTDLCQRGVLSDFDSNSFYHEVFDNSHESTQRWLESKKGLMEEEPLSALYFNYN